MPSIVTNVCRLALAMLVAGLLVTLLSGGGCKTTGQTNNADTPPTNNPGFIYETDLAGDAPAMAPGSAVELLEISTAQPNGVLLGVSALQSDGSFTVHGDMGAGSWLVQITDAVSGEVRAYVAAHPAEGGLNGVTVDAASTAKAAYVRAALADGNDAGAAAVAWDNAQ